MAPRPPLPPFTEETARQKVQAAEDAWNTRDPERVAGAYSEEASINDVPIAEADRRIFGPRSEGERGQSFPVR
jgi:nuclear transport factor 2 (NTF2) superfamily protein